MNDIEKYLLAQYSVLFIPVQRVCGFLMSDIALFTLKTKS